MNTAIAITPSAVAHPFVKAVGGKRKLVPFLKTLIPSSFGVYHEPFVGGGALFLDLGPKKGVLSDLNSKLVTAYQGVRDHSEEVIQILKSFKNDSEAYYAVRERNFDQGSIAQRAAEFIYINKTCFNGLFRENSSGRFNTPFGKNPKATICDEVNIRAVARRLHGVAVFTEDFRAITKRGVGAPKKGDLVYFDPPYAPISKTSDFTAFTKAGFGDEEQRALRDVALQLKKMGVFVMVSNSTAPIIRELYEGNDWNVNEVQAARSINSAVDKRGKITELVIT